MYKIVYTNRMRRDVRMMQRRGKNLDKLVKMLDLLASGNPIPAKFKDERDEE